MEGGKIWLEVGQGGIEMVRGGTTTGDGRKWLEVGSRGGGYGNR
jgi:hypothetical protein